MNRRNLIQLAGGLIVGEPARRAYSFLNGHGLSRSQWVTGRIGCLIFVDGPSRTELYTSSPRVDPVYWLESNDSLVLNDSIHFDL